MSDMQEARPGGPGTDEREAGASESDPVAPTADEGPEEDSES